MSTFRRLDDERIQATVERLEQRIAERFPDAGLRLVAAELTSLAEESRARCRAIRRPMPLLRVGVLLLLTALALLLGYELTVLEPGQRIRTLRDFVETLEPALGAAFFIGAMVAFLWTLELRVKRGRALTALNELRSVAHIVDMHQLTKDPSRSTTAARTASSPERLLSDAELGRYFDYCSEMLALVAKLAALYVQGFNDLPTGRAADDLEELCTGLSRKIWQKVMLLQVPG